jgi:parallel beta-helix repeat protein
MAAVLRVNPAAATTPATGATWDAAYKTIGAAISAAAVNDELWVAAATYSEHVTLKSGVALYGGFAATETLRTQRTPAVNITIIDGTNNGDAVTIANPASANTVIDGFTIQHGNSGVNANAGSATISNNIIQSNGTNIYFTGGAPVITGNTIQSSTGQGINFTSGSPVITANTIQNNHNSGVLGSGGSATVTNNTVSNNRDYGIRCDGTPVAISQNTITGSGSGAGSGIGAVYSVLAAGANPTIAGNTIYANNGSGISMVTTVAASAKIANNVIKGCTGTQGGAVFCSGGTCSVLDNVMAVNSSFNEGGAIYCKNSTVNIYNNTVVANSAGGNGGALFVDGGVVTAVNNIFGYNAPGICRVNGTLTLRKNDVYGNLVYAYSGAAAGAGDIATNPQLAGPVSRDLHIQPASPCKDAGDNSVVSGGDTDIDGQARIQNGAVDIGADESDGTVYSIPTPIIYVKPAADGGDDTNNGSSWSLAKATVQAGINAAAGGGEVWVKTGQYIEQLTLKNGVSLYGGFVGIETDKTQRTGKFITVLDGGNSDAVLTIPLGVGSPETIDSFTITNGKSYGINATLAGLAVTNTVFFSNGSGITATNCGLYLDHNTVRDNGGFGTRATTCTITATNNTYKNNTGGNGYGFYCTGSTNLTAATNSIQSSSYDAIASDSSTGSLTLTNNQILSNGRGVSWYGTATATGNTFSNNGGYAIGVSGVFVATSNIVTGNSSGISCTGTLTATGNTVTGNGAGYSNGAIECNGNGVITGNTVTDNSTTGIVWADTDGSSTASITGNTILRNTGGPNSNNGGGLYISGNAPNVQNNVIANNSANYGGGVFINASNATFANNLVYSNGTPYGGGGIYVNQGQPSLVNNTISGNSCSALGGGIYFYSTKPLVANNLVIYNTTGIARSTNSTLNLSHNDVWGSNGPDYEGFPVAPTGTNGNLSVNPILSGPPARDFHIEPASTLRNAGDVTVVQTTWVDIDGQPRTISGQVDIGADESDNKSHAVTPKVAFVNLLTGNDSSDGATWATAKATVQGGINAVAGGGSVWVAKGTYHEKITLKAGVAVYGGFTGNETDVRQRDFIANLTVLDADRSGDVVTVPSSQGATETIDGFTIGNRTSGSTFSGVVVYDSAVMLSNDIITLNQRGIYGSGAVYVLTNTTVTNNAQRGIELTANCALTLLPSSSTATPPNSPSAVTANGWDGISGDSGILSVSGASISQNGWLGIYWNNATAAVTTTAIQGNGAGAYLTGTVSATGNTITANGRYGGYPALTANGLVIVDNNQITNNSSTGLSCSTSQPVLSGYTISITNNTVSGNTVNNAVGGVYCGVSGTGSALVQFNTITGNSNTYTNGSGGGLYLDGSPEVQDNLLADNSAGYGGGIYVNQGSPLIANNGVSSNVVTNSGGGIYLYKGSPTLINNTVASNSGGTSGNGGGIYADGTNATIANSIIAFNTSGGLFKTTNSSLNLSHNDVYGSLPYDYSGYATPPTGQQGNIAIDPQLVQPTARNLHIQGTSPCRDAGDNTVLVAGWVDLYKNPRVQPTGGIVDIGCHESDGTHYVVTPIVIRVNGLTGNDTNDGSTWALAKRTIQAGINAAGGGGEIWVAGNRNNPPTPYYERLVVRSGVTLYGGFLGNETNRVQRDWVNNPTVIDGQKGGDVITVPSSAGATEIVDGFTVGNGTSGSSYSGISCANAALTLANDVLTLNSVGLYGNGAVLNVASSTVKNNSGNGIQCDSNCSLTISTAVISGNNGEGIYAGSGTLNASHITSQDNNYSGINWQNGTESVVDSTIQRNGYGLYLTGTVSALRNTVQNGRGYGSNAGITANGFVTVDHNTITGNAGGGLSCYGTQPVLTGYTINITNNTVTGNSQNNGVGGVYCRLDGTASGLIQSNTIKNNANTYVQGSGGGLYLQNGTPIVLNNTISSNSAGYGGGVFCYQSNAVIANNILTANGVSFSGGGFYCQQGSPDIINNTVTANSASLDGGALYCDNSTVTLTNTIMAFNSPGICKNTAGVLTMGHNDVFGNADYDASGFVLTGSISLDPLLAGSPARNLHIQPNSPCRDAGDDTAVQTGWTDMDGQARKQGAHVDIGADESDGTAYPTAPLIVFVKPGGDDSKDGLSWANAKQTVQAGIETAAGGGEVWVAGGIYNELVNVRTAVAVYGGFAGTETQRSQRNATTNKTIIDGGSAGTVVTVAVGAGATETLDGFTIQKSGTSASGVVCSNAALVLSNDTVQQCGYGISAAGSVIQMSNSSISNNSNGGNGNGRGISCSANCSLTLNSVTVSNNAQEGIYSDSGTLTANNLTANSNYYGGLNWNGSVSVNGGTFLADGYGVSTSGTLMLTNSIVANSTNRGANYGINATGFVTIDHTRVLNNAGYGVGVSGDHPVLTGYTVNVTNCTVSGNSIYNSPAGVYCRVTGTATSLVQGNLITGNANTYGTGSGGGLYLDGNGAQLALNNAIVGNSAGYGAGLYTNGANFTAASNLIANNSTTQLGSGVGAGAYIYQGTGYLINNTIASNTSAPGGDAGGVMADGTTLTLANNIVALNQVGGIAKNAGATLSLRNNDVFNNATYQYKGLPDPLGTNVKVDPLFVNVLTSNYHLQSTSPCIDAGDNSYLQSGWVDIDGNPRIGGTIVDIGADEYKVGSAIKLAITTQPGGARANSPFTTQPVIKATDTIGTTDPTFSGPVTAAIKAGTGVSGATLLGTTTVNAVNGVAAFTDLALDKIGTGYVLTFSNPVMGTVDSGSIEVLQGTYSTAEAVKALQIAGGLLKSTSGDVSRLGTEPPATLINILDAVRIARKVDGKDPNP